MSATAAPVAVAAAAGKNPAANAATAATATAAPAAAGAAVNAAAGEAATTNAAAPGTPTTLFKEIIEEIVKVLTEKKPYKESLQKPMDDVIEKIKAAIPTTGGSRKRSKKAKRRRTSRK
jgi:hypothetical protein